MADPEQSPSDSPSEQAPERVRPRYRPRQKSRWERIPISVRVAVPVFLVVLGWLGYQQWLASRAVVVFAYAGNPVPSLQLTLFPVQLAFNAPSPSPELGSIELEGGDSAQGQEVVLPRELVPDAVFVRYSGPGVGTGYVRARVGHDNPVVGLGLPASLTGQVVTTTRSASDAPDERAPVADARVLGLGGGEHGIVLSDATTDVDGQFTLDGFDSGLPSLGVRVLAPGYSLLFKDWYLKDPDPVFSLVPTQPIRGQVTLLEGVQADSLLVLAKGLPGVQAPVQEDGSFELDHVPPHLKPRLLLYGLPEGFTHPALSARPGDTGVGLRVLRSAFVRGYVADRFTQRPIAGAMVWHEHGPKGSVMAETGSDGSFVLGYVPAGDIPVLAQYRSSQGDGTTYVATGSRSLEIEEGVDQDDVMILVH